MITVLYILGGSILSIWVLWLLFVVVTDAAEVRDHQGGLDPVQKIFAFPALLIGYPLDFLIEKTLACVIFWERSQWGTVSERLAFYVENRDRWRYTLAKAIRKSLLRPFDRTGGHGRSF